MPAPKKRPLPEPRSAYIEDLAHDGRGIARVDGKTVFIDGALPGEQVRFRYTACHSKHDEGRVETIEQPAPERVEPLCAHFAICGGCSLQHLDADRQIEVKQAWLLDNLARIGKVRPEHVLEPLRGPSWSYRRKARLGVKFVVKKDRVLVGFRERRTPYLADLRRCEILHPRVGGLLEPLSELIGGLSIARRLPQIEVAVGDTEVALSLRTLDPPSAEDKARLVAFGQAHEVQIWLQPKGPQTTYPLYTTQATLSYRLPAYDLSFEFKPYHFTQINADINRQMVDRAVNLLDVRPDETVLDLFCGLGNFTLALARRAREVVGVEGDADLVDWAVQNAARNQVDNARFTAADLAGDLPAQPWLQTKYDKILLDPPRSGALEMMPLVGATGARRIVYVSCHPATLARDVGELTRQFGYKLDSAGVMDMFPHTAHVESIALLVR